jgi:spore coat polysaccharide biosynthesis protein SpsF
MKKLPKWRPDVERNQTTNVYIAIQARSSSQRLPRKAFELIDGKRMLDHVIDACRSAANYLNRFADKNGLKVQVVLLTPEGDAIVEGFKGVVPIYEGPEHDVLTRYANLAKKVDLDYVVRITGDCPLIPPFVISKLIKLAQSLGYDYVSNVDEDSRTTLDGSDCEVFSRRMLEYLDQTATLPADREHVTTLARRSPPDWANLGVVINHYDHSDIKLSVDTPEDLERVRTAKERLSEIRQRAHRKYGKLQVHHL